jgi:hypothetical protein
MTVGAYDAGPQGTDKPGCLGYIVVPLVLLLRFTFPTKNTVRTSALCCLRWPCWPSWLALSALAPWPERW